MKLNRIAFGLLPVMTLLLAASAGAQIRSTTAPATPPADDTKADNSAKTRKPARTAAHGATRGTTHSATTRQATTAKTTAAKTTAPAVQPPAAAAATPEKAKTYGPGRNIGTDGKVRECDARDPSPEGTVIDGYKKVKVPSPFTAHACQWRAVE